MNLRISQFTQATTLDSGDLIPIVNEQVTKRTTLASVTAISTEYTSKTYLPLTGGIITGDLGVTNSLTANNAQVLNTLTVVGTVSTAKHGTSKDWESGSTIVAAKSALWTGSSTIVQANSAKWQSTHTTVKDNSAKWESAYTILDANAYNWGLGIKGPGIFGFIPKYTDITTIGNSQIFENISGNVGIGTTAPIPAKLTVKGSIMADGNLDISGFTTLSSAWIKGNLRIDGTLSSLGPEVKIDTMTAFTTALQINNTGIGPALRVTQAGAQNVATFSDENDLIMCISDNGNVGIGGGANTCNTDPSVKLDVMGPTKLGTTVIRDWNGTTDIATIANIRPGTGTSSAFGSIIEGRPSGHILIGINSNDSQDGFSVVSKSYPTDPVLPSTGYYLRNCFTVMNTGNVGIGVQYPSAARLDILSETIDQPIINLRPPSGTFGNRSILSFWSTFAGATNGDTSARRSADIVSGFSKDNWGNQYLAFHVGNDITANDSAILNREKVRITSTCCVGIGETDPLRRLHISNNGASEMIIEQTDAKADFRKWNFVVDGGTTNGGGVASRFYIRQLNDAATGGSIPFLISGNGRVGINDMAIPGAHLHVNGDAIFGASITTGYNITTGDCPVNLGALRTGDGNTYIDFHAQDRQPSAIDFDARLIRAGGENGEFGLVNTGTGLMTLKQTGAASMVFQTNSLERMAIASNGNVGINTAGITIQEKLHVAGNILVGTNGNNIGVQDSNYIRFAGTYGDAGTARFHSFIAERRYVANSEKSELLIAKGNDPHFQTSGPDRIRLLGAAIAFDTYNNYVDTTSVESMASGGDTTMYIMPTGVGIGDAFPTSNPVTLLHINRSNYAAIQLGNNNNTGFTITKESSDNSFNIWTGAVGSGTNRFRINSFGNISINTSLDYTERLTVSGNLRVIGNIYSNDTTLWNEVSAKMPIDTTIDVSRFGEQTYLNVDIKGSFDGPQSTPFAQPFIITEKTGSIVGLRSGYNGMYTKYFYFTALDKTMKGFISTDSEYRPSFLLVSEYVSEIIDGNKYGMFAEIKSYIGAATKYYWVTINSTLNPAFHTFKDVTTIVNLYGLTPGNGSLVYCPEGNLYITVNSPGNNDNNIKTFTYRIVNATSSALLNTKTRTIGRGATGNPDVQINDNTPVWSGFQIQHNSQQRPQIRYSVNGNIIRVSDLSEFIIWRAIGVWRVNYNSTFDYDITNSNITEVFPIPHVYNNDNLATQAAPFYPFRFTAWGKGQNTTLRDCPNDSTVVFETMKPWGNNTTSYYIATYTIDTGSSWNDVVTRPYNTPRNMTAVTLYNNVTEHTPDDASLLGKALYNVSFYSPSRLLVYAASKQPNDTTLQNRWLLATLPDNGTGRWQISIPNDALSIPTAIELYPFINVTGPHISTLDAAGNMRVKRRDSTSPGNGVFVEINGDTELVTNANVVTLPPDWEARLANLIANDPVYVGKSRSASTLYHITGRLFLHVFTYVTDFTDYSIYCRLLTLNANGVNMDWVGAGHTTLIANTVVNSVTHTVLWSEYVGIYFSGTTAYMIFTAPGVGHTAGNWNWAFIATVNTTAQTIANNRVIKGASGSWNYKTVGIHPEFGPYVCWADFDYTSKVKMYYATPVGNTLDQKMVNSFALLNAQPNAINQIYLEPPSELYILTIQSAFGYIIYSNVTPLFINGKQYLLPKTTWDMTDSTLWIDAKPTDLRNNTFYVYVTVKNDEAIIKFATTKAITIYGYVYIGDITTNTAGIEKTNINGATVIGNSVYLNNVTEDTYISGNSLYTGARIMMNADGAGMSWLCSTGTNAEVAAGNTGRAALGFHVTNTTTGACDYVQCKKPFRCEDDIVAFWSSDYRLKDNIINIANSLQKVSELRGVSFNWNDKLQSVHTGEDVGVIAQDVELVIPSAVTERENGYKAVKYEKIIPLLIEAIKELKAEVDTLKDMLNK